MNDVDRNDLNLHHRVTNRLCTKILFPLPDLRPYVKYYVFGKINLGEGVRITISIRPNNDIEIVFLVNFNNLLSFEADLPDRGKGYILGLCDSHNCHNLKVISGGVLQWTSIVLTTVGFSKLFDFQLRELKNSITDLCTVMPNIDKIIPDRSFWFDDDKARCNKANDCLRDCISKSTFCGDSRLNSLQSSLTKMSGDCTIGRLSNELCVSYRTVERIFSDQMGINAQEYFKINRFIKVFRYLHGQTRIHYPELVELGHYFDQSHLTNDFKQFTGFTPKQFLNISQGRFYQPRPVFFQLGTNQRKSSFTRKIPV